MTHPVTSKFSTMFWVKAVLLTLVLFGCTIACINNITEYKDNYSGGQISSVYIFSGVFLVVYVYMAIRTVRRITAASEGLIIEYLITKKKIVIDYADITHVDNVIVSSSSNGFNYPGYGKLKIDLTTGEEISILKADIDNYDELKEAIRRYRFHLP